MISGPKITVVTPSYNQGQFLEQTLRSVVDQDYPNIEYIIVDGGSTDNSVEIIGRYSDRIDYWVSETDNGQADAIAKGFAIATGDVMCWLNSDDVFLPGALSKVASFFARHPAAEVVSGGCYYIDANGAPLIEESAWGVYTLGGRATYNQFRFCGGLGLVWQQSTFWRRKAYEEVGGLDTKLQFILDLDLFTRLAQRGRFYVIPHFLAAFRLHDETKSRKIKDIRIKEYDNFLMRYGCNDYSTIIRGLLFWRHRVPILVAKVFLRMLRNVGAIKLESIPFG